jgi:DNA-binding response OmpR family regulator
MRRTNSGAARRISLAHPARGRGSETAVRRRANDQAPPSPPLSRITVIPVVVSPALLDSPAVSISDGAFVRMSEAVHARSVNQRIVDSRGADVILLDARESRPTLVYRAIVRLRNAGWNRGIVLLIDAADMATVSVASSIGATDFVLATASPAELEARLRRSTGRPTHPDTKVRTSQSASGIELHWRTHQVSFEGTTISVTLRELQVLAALMERGPEIVTAEDLARLAWGKQRKAGGGLAAAYVCSLRKKLAWFGGRFGIRTVRGVGYRFVV